MLNEKSPRVRPVSSLPMSSGDSPSREALVRQEPQLETRYGQPAVDHDNLTCREREITARQGGNGTANIIREAPARLDTQTFADEVVVFVRLAAPRAPAKTHPQPSLRAVPLCFTTPSPRWRASCRSRRRSCVDVPALGGTRHSPPLRFAPGPHRWCDHFRAFASVSRSENRGQTHGPIAVGNSVALHRF